MGNITYIKGDATSPVGDGKKIIVHICNDLGAWGAGFVLALSKKWRAPEEVYRLLRKRILGTVLVIPVEDDIMVANMIGQHGVGYDKKGNPPIRYAAVRAALNEVNNYAYYNHCTIHMPRIGCGLAGGSWDEIEKIIQEVCDVDVYVYDL